MRDKPEVSTGAACLSPGGLPRSLSALAPVDACVRPRAARPRMRPTAYYHMTPVPGRGAFAIMRHVDGYACYDGTCTGFGADMQEAYEDWKAKQAEYYWPVSP